MTWVLNHPIFGDEKSKVLRSCTVKQYLNKISHHQLSLVSAHIFLASLPQNVKKSGVFSRLPADGSAEILLLGPDLSLFRKGIQSLGPKALRPPELQCTHVFISSQVLREFQLSSRKSRVTSYKGLAGMVISIKLNNFYAVIFI